ncbi:MAG: DUF4982 domain-containing protein [Bacteroidales bacterium]|nr:DUF4982 domain-containing protein [Bacteroidales bacterium]
MKRIYTLATLILLGLTLIAGPRERQNFDDGWKFALGDASSMANDFGYGTEYFNFWTKAASIHNTGPYSPDFDPSGWADVCLPHDWVVDLPFAGEASHSHGYKTVGAAYPQTSVGWYRKEFELPVTDEGKHVSLRFDGIFHSSQLWVNGFYLGREDDGYVSSEYDITQYLNYGGKNVVAVRADASQESGWFYEGAGIYRHAWLIKKGEVNIIEDGLFIHSDLLEEGGATVHVEAEIGNFSLAACSGLELVCALKDAEGRAVAEGRQMLDAEVLPRETRALALAMEIKDPHLWDVDDPYLYTATVSLCQGGEILDSFDTQTGIRSIEFSKDNGFLLNGKRVQLKGVNLHQDHAGVGSAITDDIYEYRLMRLRSIGVNAIRSSHNPMAPALLDLCDRMGFLVMDENRLMGVNQYHQEHLERMIRRDRNHPCVILWSIGNEEWGIEWKDFGRRLTAAMREMCHRADPTRPMTVATSSGPVIVEPADVAGYNYILQNDVEGLHQKYPERRAVGTEETTGCGTRGWYFDDPTGGHMPAINRGKQGSDSLYNAIERGWKFYHSRPYHAGLFYWTGFDYRGESNPLTHPATGSSFGILDYCGFCKDEAYYLKSWWTQEPVLHILPHWNLAGHEGEDISVWVYSNCDEVELIANGKRLGRKKMPLDGHLEWTATYKPGYVQAKGYKNGRLIMKETVRTSSGACVICTETFLRPGTAIIDISLKDKDGNFVPDASCAITAEVEGPAYIMGVGNGDSAWKESERPSTAVSRTSTSENATHTWHAFNGCAQIIIGSKTNSIGKGTVKIRLSADGCEKEISI